MANSSIIQVIQLLCIIFSFTFTTTAVKNEVAGDNGFYQIPGLATLKDVNIWKNGEIASLSTMFGPDPEEWNGDFHVVAEMSFTALSCLYSSKLVDFIRTAENDFMECRGFLDNQRTADKFFDCWSVIKLQLKSLQSVAVQMLTTALNYTKTFNIRADQNVLNAIMSFYLFVNTIKDGEFEVRENLFEKFINMKLYTRYLIETFAVQNCPWSTFDVEQLNQIDGIEILNEVNLPETYFKREHLDPKKLFLPGVLAIRVDYDYQSDYSKLEYMRVNYEHSEIYLQAYAIRYGADFHSEIITQSQTIVFQCIVSTVFSLINQIIALSIKDKKKINKDTETGVVSAINVLKRFNFPGLLHVKLRKELYQRMISLNICKPDYYVFEGLQFNIENPEENITYEKKTSVKALTDMLKHFSNNLLSMEHDITTVKEINQILCDYEYGEVGFLQYDSSTLNVRECVIGERARAEQVIPILQRLKENNCQFSHYAVIHFILIDFIILQCKAILSDLNNLDTASLLRSCFDSMVKAIKLIEDTLDHSLVATLDILKSTKPHNNANRKVIDSMLAMKLYLSNGNLLNSRVPLTAQKSVDVNRVVSKLDVLKRYNRFIINLIEHYTVHSCSTPSTRENFTNNTLTKIIQKCKSAFGQNNKAQLLECVDEIIIDNLKMYEVVESQINRNDYTIANLLMNDIVEKDLNRNNGFSMLHELTISWEGDHKRLTEIVDIVKNNINPKYLCKYQSIVIKSVVFVVYDKIKTIIQSSTSSNNFQLYRSKMNTILNALNVIRGDFFPLGMYRVYETIVNSFKEYFRGDASIDKKALIRVIEVEQYYLGMKNPSSGTTFDEIVHSIPDHTLRTSSKSHDVGTVVSSRLEMNGQYNINQLLSYLDVVEHIRTNLTNVALVLDLRRMSSLQI